MLLRHKKVTEQPEVDTMSLAISNTCITPQWDCIFRTANLMSENFEFPNLFIFFQLLISTETFVDDDNNHYVEGMY